MKPTYEELEEKVKELEGDITQWRHTRQLLSESEELYRLLVESARDVIYTISLKAEILSVNPAFEKNTGWSSDEIIGKPLTVLVHPDDWPLAMNMGLRALNGEKPPLHEVRILKNSGDYAVCEFLITPFFSNEKIVAILGIGRDITEKKQLEQALKESEIRYRGIFRYTNNGVAIYKAINAGEDFICTDVNRSAERIDGIICTKVVGKSVLEIFPAIKEFGLFDVFLRVWRTGTSERYPIAQYKDDRISGWRENYVYKLPSGEIVAVYSDETERMQADEALENAYEELEQKIKERTAELSQANLKLIQEINERKQSEAERENLIKKLQEALSEVKTLSGLFPICASCKKIRDDKGYWNQIEAYIRKHSDAEFSHSICPECAKKLYPKLYDTDD
jgi:PAS domain S-box-containing protein